MTNNTEEDSVSDGAISGNEWLHSCDDDQIADRNDEVVDPQAKKTSSIFADRRKCCTGTCREVGFENNPQSLDAHGCWSVAVPHNAHTASGKLEILFN